jgi:hypothetical protein
MLFVNRCESYFHQQRIMEEEKVWMASYHLEGVAQSWYLQLPTDEGTPRWHRFKDILQLRFGPPLRSAPLFELAECRRTGTMEEYQNRFQELLSRAGPLEERQRVQLFTGGLLSPLSHGVRIHNPQSLATAMSLARQVELMELDRAPAPAHIRPAARGVLPPPPPKSAPIAFPAPHVPLALPAPPAGVAPGRGGGRRLSTEEMAERRHLGLCFNCNDKYSRGHNRFCKRIFFIEGVEILDEDGTDHPDGPDAEAPCFSLQAVSGCPVADTMQVAVMLGATPLVALLDSGSTHNFISEAAAWRSGLPQQQRLRLSAMVANGERITCVGVIRNAPLTIGGDAFPANLFVMSLAGYDIVLGTRWLGALGPIVWDLACRRMSFQHHDRTVCWNGVPTSSAPVLGTTTATEPLLAALLDTFAHVFAEPAGLPPLRAHDHHIILKQGTQPVAVRPYWYPAAHKDELERQCAAMIEQGIVRRSNSLFSSSVLLVKKPDGSWRFCVDYRTLNVVTIKDAFPIPVVDELLDELYGARFFSKLDLRSGYHQVRMRPEDVHKTVFRTHDGLYEFLVMAFGLCNASATFQALMNNVLRPFLCRLVLVFFDDILIYSKNWEEHLHHLRMVLENCNATKSSSSAPNAPSEPRPSPTSVMSSRRRAWPWTRQRCRPSSTSRCCARLGRCAGFLAWRATTASLCPTTARSPHHSRPSSRKTALPRMTRQRRLLAPSRPPSPLHQSSPCRTSQRPLWLSVTHRHTGLAPCSPKRDTRWHSLAVPSLLVTRRWQPTSASSSA